MSGSILEPYRWQVNYNGSPAAGALLYSYLSGGSTPQVLYSDSALSVPLTNPVVADSNGIFQIMYMSAVSYRITITAADGSMIFPAQDNIYDLWELFQATTRTANTFYAGPASGSAATPTFRALVAADLSSFIQSTLPLCCQGRITLTSGVAVTTADVTAAPTVYFTPYHGNRCSLYDGAAWQTITFTETALALGTDTTGNNYDLFGYLRTGALAIERLVWTNNTTRATTLTLQDGAWTKTGDATRLFLGTYRTTNSGQTEDSLLNRLVWNNFNRIAKPLAVSPPTTTWNYTTATIRQANGSASAQVSIMQGIAESPIAISLTVGVGNSTGGITIESGIGEDSTTTFLTNPGASTEPQTGASNVISQVTTSVVLVPTAGWHVFTWLEFSAATGTTSWYGSTLIGTGMYGSWPC